MFGSDSPAVVRSSRHHTMSVTSPKVQTIAAPVPLSGLGEVVTVDLDLGIEERRAHLRADEVLVRPLRVRHDRDAGGQQLGTGGLDRDGSGSVREREVDGVVRGLLVAILELGLRDRGAEVDVPQGRREGLVRLAALEVAQERELALPDRCRPRSCGRSGSSRRSGRAGGTAPRTASRPLSVSRSHSSMKLRRLIGSWSAARQDLLSPPSNGGVKSGS